MTEVYLSPNFTLREFTRSQNASRLGISNQPTPEHLENMKLLCRHVLEPIRAYYRKPLALSSGYRSKELNAKTPGSSSTSQHSTGEAADFEIAGIPNIDVVKWIKANLQFDQCILEFYVPGDPNSGWVHCSYESKGPQRREVLTATRVNGKTVYTKGLPK